jgi:hypothetical protein
MSSNALAGAHAFAAANPDLEPLLAGLVNGHLPLMGPAETYEGDVLRAALCCYHAVAEADANLLAGKAFRADVEFLRDQGLDVPNSFDAEAWDGFVRELLPRL